MIAPRRLAHFPVSFFSMVMGLAGLTIAMQKAEHLLDQQAVMSHLLAVFSVVVFVIIAIFYVLKLLREREAVVSEFRHPIKLHFFPTISISLLLLSVVLLERLPTASLWLWSAGAVMHGVLTLKIMTMWMHHAHFEIIHMNPSWFIPAVGNIIVPIAGVVHAPIEVSWFFFSIGLVFWVILLVIFFNRVIFHHPLPDKLLPTLFILIAPPAVGFIAYYQLTQQFDAFAHVLYYFALFTFILLLTQARLFSRISFFLSWWAYSFPIAALTIATFDMYNLTQRPFFYGLAFALLAGLSVLILMLLIKTLQAVMRGEICQPEP